VHLPAHLAAKVEVYRRSSKLRTKLAHECCEARRPAMKPHCLPTKQANLYEGLQATLSGTAPSCA